MTRGDLEARVDRIRALPAASLALGFLAALAGLAVSCQLDQSKDDAFQGVLPLCNELFVAESKTPGVDATAHLDDLSRQVRARAAAFDTPAGVAYLRSRLEREPDDHERACINRLLAGLRQDDA